MRKQSGVTLLEILLVLVIAAAILYLSLQQYRGWRRSAEVSEIHRTVDQLFQIMTNYYRANCSSHVKTNVKPPYGDLSAATSQNLSLRSVRLDLNYLQATRLITPIHFPTSSLIRNVPGQDINGFVAQFNRVVPMPDVTRCATGKMESGLTAYGPCPANAPGKVVGKALIWRSQVAVHLNITALASIEGGTEPADQARAYKNYLGADCLSSYDNSTNTVLPCNASGDSGDYAVWERAPSSPSASSTARSTYWLSMPTLHQFTQRYTNTSVEIDGTQYFECGD